VVGKRSVTTNRETSQGTVGKVGSGIPVPEHTGPPPWRLRVKTQVSRFSSIEVKVQDDRRDIKKGTRDGRAGNGGRHHDLCSGNAMLTRSQTVKPVLPEGVHVPFTEVKTGASRVLTVPRPAPVCAWSRSGSNQSLASCLAGTVLPVSL